VIDFSFTILKEDRVEFELTQSGHYYLKTCQDVQSNVFGVMLRHTLYPELLYCQFRNQDRRIPVGFSFTILKEDLVEFELTQSGNYYYFFWITDFHCHFGMRN
jgi:hypothetical protein